MYVWHSNQANTEKRSAAYRMTDQLFDKHVDMESGEYAKIVLSKFSSIQKVTVCTLETTASLDIRVLDFNDPDDRGDRGSKCILQRQDDYEGTIVYQKEGDSSCQNFICAGTSVKTYFGQVVTVKSVQDSALRIAQVQVHGVEIDCPYSAFSNEDGYYDIPMLEPSGELPKNMHAGVIPSTIDVFDPIEDKLLLEANSRSEPEALLFSLHICDETIRGYRQNGYRGCQTKTTSGRTCQRWTSQSPHEHSNTPGRYLDKGLGNHNYCRNPGGTSGGIWCYTIDPHRRWEYCDPLLSYPSRGEVSVSNLGGHTATYLTNFAGGNTYPSGWQRPMYSVSKGICYVDGEVTVRSWGHLLTLPPDCRPSKSIGFSLNNHANQARVDVSSDGRVVWRAGGHDHGWLLLSGMVFQTTSASPTYLTNFAGGNTYPSGWQRPMYSVIDGQGYSKVVGPPVNTSARLSTFKINRFQLK